MPFLMALLLLALSCGKASSNSKTAVVGGSVASQPYPWFAGVFLSPKAARPACGGTFISDRIVITAAHCVAGLKPEQLAIRPGIAAKDHPTLGRIAVRTIAVHPGWSRKTMANDVALLFLDHYDNSAAIVRPIEINQALPWPPVQGQQHVRALGRGMITSFGTLYDDVVREVNLPVVPLDQCMALYRSRSERVGSENICAGDIDAGAVDSCLGDSGGPLLSFDSDEPRLLGLVSWGVGCAQKGFPGVYTRIASHQQWIESTIDQFSRPPFPENSAISKLVGSFCAGAFRRLAFSALDPDGNRHYVSSEFAAIAPFEKTKSAAVPKQIDCKFSLENGRNFVGTIGEQQLHLHELGTNDTWSAPSKEKLNQLTLNCQSQTHIKAELNLESGLARITHGTVSYAGSEKYDGDFSASENLSQCAAEGYLVTLATHASKLIASFSGPLIGRTSKSFIIQPIRSQQQSLILHTAIHDGETIGSLTLTNATSTDIFTWELQCPFAYSLEDSLGVRYQSRHDEDLSRRLAKPIHTVRFIYPDSRHGALRRSQNISFDLQLPAPWSGTTQCFVNQIAAQIDNPYLDEK